MSFFTNMFEYIKNFGPIEWSLIAIIAILLITLFAFNKAALMAQQKLVTYENELKEAKQQLNDFQAKYVQLINDFGGGEEDEN